jgi:hypothetical protein
MKILRLIPLAALACTGCATLPQTSADPWTRLGEATRAGPVILRPDRLVEDSRCPMNARCVWAGRVVVEATLWVDGKLSTAQIASDRAIPAAGGTLSMDAIRPEGFMTSNRPQPQDYELRFAFRPNE